MWQRKLRCILFKQPPLGSQLYQISLYFSSFFVHLASISLQVSRNIDFVKRSSDQLRFYQPKKKKKWPITPVFYDHPSNNLVLKINLVFYHYFKKMINWPNSDMRLCWFQGSNRQWRLWDYFLGEPIRNINYTKFKTKENLNILTLQKTKTEIHKILQLLSTMFHILKSLQNIFIINFMSYISFNVYSQAIIHLLISQLIDLFQKF